MFTPIFGASRRVFFGLINFHLECIDLKRFCTFHLGMFRLFFIFFLDPNPVVWALQCKAPPTNAAALKWLTLYPAGGNWSALPWVRAQLWSPRSWSLGELGWRGQTERRVPWPLFLGTAGLCGESKLASPREWSEYIEDLKNGHQYNQNGDA